MRAILTIRLKFSPFNTASFKQKGMKPLLEKLKLLGGWPVLDGDKWQDEDFDCNHAIYKRKNVGYPIRPFFVLGIEIDQKNSDKQIIYVCFYPS